MTSIADIQRVRYGTSWPPCVAWGSRLNALPLTSRNLPTSHTDTIFPGHCSCEMPIGIDVAVEVENASDEQNDKEQGA